MSLQAYPLNTNYSAYCNAYTIIRYTRSVVRAIELRVECKDSLPASLQRVCEYSVRVERKNKLTPKS